MDFLKLIGAAVVGWLAYYLTITQGIAAGVGFTAFLVAVGINQIGAHLEQIGKSLDFNFDALRHLQRKPNGEPYDMTL